MFHVTFRDPLPRIMINDRSTPLAAVFVDGWSVSPEDLRHIELPGHICLNVRVVYPDRASSGARMKTDLIIHRDHIASIVEAGEPK